jgi:hypothetical protein
MDYYGASSGNFCPTFWDQADDGADSLSPNVGKKLLLLIYVTTQKNTGFIYFAAEAWNHGAVTSPYYATLRLQ